MIWRIAKKEFLLNLMTFKFVVGTVLCAVLTAVFMPVLVNDYQQRLEVYNKNVAANEAQFRKVKVYKNITPTVYRPPAVLSVFSAGVEKQLGDSAKIELERVPEISAASAEGNPYLSIFPVFDASLIFKIVISVLALLVAYDVVSGERERGTLKLIVSGTVARYQVLFGKLVAGLMTLAVPTTIAFAVALLILLRFPMVDLTGWDWVRVGLMYLTSLALVSVMYNIGLLFSCLAKKSAISLVLGLFVWIVCAVVIPNGSVYLATQVRPLEAREKMDGEIASLREQLASELGELQISGGGTRSDAAGAFGNWYHQLCDRPQMEYCRKYYAFAQPLHIKYAEKLWEVEHRYLISLFKQRRLADNLSRLSPISLHENALSTLAGTDLASFQDFVEEVRTYRNEVREYVGSKTDNFSASSLFTPCTEEEMLKYENMLARTEEAQNEADRERAYAAFKVWVEVRKRVTPSLDLQDFPPFTHEIDVLRSLSRAIPNLALLTLLNAVFFSMSFVALMKYDVR